MIQVFAKVLVKRPDGQILVLKRSSSDDRRPNEWDFPGGTAETSESPNEAAARELFEEAGIKVNHRSLQLVYAATDYWAKADDSNTRVLFLIAVNDEQADHITLSHEHSEFKWQTPLQALADHPHPIYKAGLQYSLDHNLV